MKSKDELPDLMIELIENVNTETGIPKFPKRATEIVREISSYAKTTRLYKSQQKRADSVLEKWKKPEDVFVFMLEKVVDAPFELLGNASVILLMPVLEKALDSQRRCRVCGCTDSNGCVPVSCYWVEDDLCSECAGAVADQPGKARAGKKILQQKGE